MAGTLNYAAKGDLRQGGPSHARGGQRRREREAGETVRELASK